MALISGEQSKTASTSPLSSMAPPSLFLTTYKTQVLISCTLPCETLILRSPLQSCGLHWHWGHYTTAPPALGQGQAITCAMPLPRRPWNPKEHPDGEDPASPCSTGRPRTLGQDCNTTCPPRAHTPPHRTIKALHPIL